MKINIASTHRFHLLDLARELSHQGHDVVFYSYVPKGRCMKFGLCYENIKSFTWLVAPFFFFQKMFGNKSWITKYRNIIIDKYLKYFMRPCDVYIALGTVYYESFISAHKRFNAKTIMEWGSKYIDEQQLILKLINAPTNDEYFNERSRLGYKVVDYIAISSEHVKDSFIKYGFPPNKLLINHYGVDLSMFYPTKLAQPIYDLIMVGGWRLRKGCDLLVKLCEKYNYSLLHVGSITDMAFPVMDNMKHVDSVNQDELVNYYAHARVFILPSREEGLAMVQAQAIVCGLPLVCSKDSGGRDLAKMIDSPEFIIEAENLDLSTLHKCVEQALELASSQEGVRSYAGDIRKNLTWKAYGQRYNDNLRNIVCNE